MILALSDYESYITQYDITKKQLLQEYTIKSKQNNYVFSIAAAQQYFSQFTGINISAENIRVYDYDYCQNSQSTPQWNGQQGIDYCYEITEWQLENKKISFLFFPTRKK